MKQWASFAALLCLGVTLTAPVNTQEKAPETAKTLIQSAQKKEKKPYKTILVMFHASW